MPLRRRRIANANHEWINRPGGWVQDGAITEEGTEVKREALIDCINPYPDAISRRLKVLLWPCTSVDFAKFDLALAASCLFYPIYSLHTDSFVDADRLAGGDRSSPASPGL